LERFDLVLDVGSTTELCCGYVHRRVVRQEIDFKSSYRNND
jgi:hypothetical protein